MLPATNVLPFVVFSSVMIGLSSLVFLKSGSPKLSRHHEAREQAEKRGWGRGGQTGLRILQLMGATVSSGLVGLALRALWPAPQIWVALGAAGAGVLIGRLALSLGHGPHDGVWLNRPVAWVWGLVGWLALWGVALRLLSANLPAASLAAAGLANVFFSGLKRAGWGNRPHAWTGEALFKSSWLLFSWLLVFAMAKGLPPLDYPGEDVDRGAVFVSTYGVLFFAGPMTLAFVFETVNRHYSGSLAWHRLLRPSGEQRRTRLSEWTWPGPPSPSAPEAVGRAPSPQLIWRSGHAFRIQVPLPLHQTLPRTLLPRTDDRSLEGLAARLGLPTDAQLSGGRLCKTAHERLMTDPLWYSWGGGLFLKPRAPAPAGRSVACSSSCRRAAARGTRRLAVRP